MANTIAKAIYTLCDSDRNEYIHLDKLINIKHTEDALTLDQQQIAVNVASQQHKSTMGWVICCQWKELSTSWEKLSNLKESHPVQVAQFAIQMGVALEPGFNWWVFRVLKKRDTITLMVKRRMLCS